jgi:hypothetical protein
MKNWQKGMLGAAGILGSYLLGKLYLDSKVKEAGFDPVPEGSFLDKIKLFSRSPYKKIQL